MVGVAGAAATPVSSQRIPTGNSEPWFGSIACPSTTNCFARGTTLSSRGPVTNLFGLEQGRWRRVTVPHELPAVGVVQAISCATQTNCLAIGGRTPNGVTEYAVALAWNGKRWRRVMDTGARANLLDVSCTGPNYCVAVGQDVSGGPLARLWNGRSWRNLHPPGRRYLVFESVSCWAVGRCTVLGNKAGATPRAVVEQLHGSRWTLQNSRSPSGTNLLDITCLADGTCLAVGERAVGHSTVNHEIAEDWNGHRWKYQQLSQSNSVLTTVSCIGNGPCLAVGLHYAPHNRSTSIIDEYHAGRWTPVAAGAFTNRLILDVTCTTATCQILNDTDRNTLVTPFVP